MKIFRKELWIVFVMAKLKCLGQSMCFLTGLTFLGGCCELKSPRETFLSEQKLDRANYVKVYETSIESLREQEERLFRISTNMVYNFRQFSEQCPTNAQCPPVNEMMERIQKIAEGFRKEELLRIGKLNQIYDSKTDSILFYDYVTETNSEGGWVVLKGSTIKGKIILEKHP